MRVPYIRTNNYQNMRKVLLLLSTVFIFNWANAQVDTVINENFDGVIPSWATPSASTVWDTTASLSLTPNVALRGTPAATNGTYVLDLPAFNTASPARPAVFLSFFHTAKLFAGNQARLRVSTDGGSTFTIINDSLAYKGESPSYNQTGVFNEFSYNIPNQGLDIWKSNQNIFPDSTYWVQDSWDISSYCYNQVTNTGYSSVIIRLEIVINQTSPPGGLRAGWFIDNILLLKSPCELDPPKLDFNYVPFPCFAHNPEGGLTENAFDSTYTIGVKATDDTSGIDYVLLHHRIRKNGIVGAWSADTMVLSGATDEYRADLYPIIVGDTVDWYVKAFDLACPNTTNSPDSITRAYYTFYPLEGLPLKCGLPDCGTLPGTIKNFPWIEDFEGPEFTSGTGTGNTGSGTSYRGGFPVDQTGNSYWNVTPNPTQSGYAWSVRSGPTATPLTGPIADHSANGNNYLYTESSQGSVLDETRIITPCIDLTQLPTDSTVAFEFWYHMFGDDIGNIRVDIDTGSNTASWYTRYARLKDQQQDSTDAEWKRMIVDLTPFIGQIIRINISSFKLKAGVLGDIAIDDFKIFQPSAEESEILSFDSPEANQCGYSASEDVTIHVRHAGGDTIPNIPVAYRINSGAVVNETITGPFVLGFDTVFTFSTKADLSALGSYVITAWTNHANDGNRVNDTARSQTIVNKIVFSSFPYIQDFEDGIVGTQNVGPNSILNFYSGQDNNYNWNIGERLTSTRNTGPISGYYVNGKYLYSEADGSSGNVSTFMQTECLDFTGMNNPVVDFYYHLYGADIQSIEIESQPGNVSDVWTVVPGSVVSGNGQQSAESNNWKFKRVNLSSFANQVVKLRFVANRKTGSNLADAAIDKIMIYDRIAADAGASFVTRPNRGSGPNGTSPLIEVYNFGTSNISNVPVVIELKPLCGPNKGVPVTYNVTHSGTITPGNFASVSFNQTLLNIIFEYGTSEIKAYTNLTGDTHSFNDTVAKNIQTIGQYNVPFFNNFDSCDYDESGFQSAKDDLQQWEFGDPGAPINNSKSTPNAWTIWKDGNFYNGTNEILKVPFLIGFDTIQSAEVRFHQWLDFAGGGNSAAAALTYATGSNNFDVVGAADRDISNGTNWLYAPFASPTSPLFSNDPAWTGNTGGWVFSSYRMDFYNLQSNPLVLQFEFKTTTGAPQTGGWSIDDFEIYVPPQNSAAPYSIRTVNPLVIPGNEQTLTTIVENTGAKLLKEFVYKVSIDGVTLNTGGFENDTVLVKGFVTRGSRLRDTLDHKWQAPQVTAGLKTATIISSRPNDKQDNLTTDDTLEYPILVLDEYIFDVNTGDTSYCNNFDASLGTLDFFTANTYTYFEGPSSWEKGTPTQFPGAFSPPGAWMTGLDSNYSSRDSSSLFTPVFVVDSGQAYEMTFMHQYATERLNDGGNIQVSTDGGLSWLTIGYANEKDWYNTDFVTGLELINPGWTDTSSGWDSARYVMSFDTDDKVIFKFWFESDWDIQDKGWAIDDFCFKMTNKKPEFVIGQEEFNQPVESIFFSHLAPNPANDITSIAFKLNEPKHIQVRVNNMMGQLIQEFDSDYQRGTSKIDFDTQRWDSGVYNIQMIVDGQMVSRKLVVSH